jgi:hypothetical protein
MVRRYVAAAIAAVLLITACSKAPQSPTTESGAPSTNPKRSPAEVEQATQAAEATRAAQLPQPDWSTPDSAYVPMTKGTQMMFLYAAFSGRPPDYETMAKVYDPSYRTVTDTFKKHDLLAALVPKLDAGIADAKPHPYISWTDDQPALGHYDFSAHAFPDQSAVLMPHGSLGFYDGPGYQLTVTNGQAFQQLALADESKARPIESLLGQWQALHVKRFGFIQGTTDPDFPDIEVMLTKEQLLDAHGQVLLEQIAPH